MKCGAIIEAETLKEEVVGVMGESWALLHMLHVSCLSHIHVEMFSGKLGVQIQEQASNRDTGMDMERWKSWSIVLKLGTKYNHLRSGQS